MKKTVVGIIANHLVSLSQYLFWPLLVIVITSLVIAGPRIWPLQINNTLDTLLEQGTEQQAIDRSIQETFGSLDEIIILAYHDKNLFSYDNLRLIEKLTDDIESLPEVDNCFSLSNTPYFDNYEEDGDVVISMDPLLHNLKDDPTHLETIKNNAVSNDLFVNNIVSKDGNTTAFNIILDHTLGAFEKEAAVRKIREVYKSYDAEAEGQFYFTGMHVFMETTGEQMQKDVTQFSIFSVILLFIALYTVFRSFPLVFTGILTAVVSNWLLLCTLYYLERTLSISTTPVPAITMGLSIAYILHFIVAKKEGTLSSKEEAGQIFTCNLLSSFTTMIGFLSLCLNPIPTLQDFGLFAGLGAFYSALSAMFIGYPLLSMIKVETTKEFAAPLKNKVEHIFINYRKAVVIVSVLVFLSFGFILRMEVETDYYQYYMRSAPMPQAVDFVNNNIGGQYPIVVELSSDKREAIYDEHVLRFLEDLSDYTMTFAGVDKIISYLDLLNDGCRVFTDEVEPGWYSNRAMVSQVAMMVNDASREINDSYINSRASNTLVFIRTSHINSAEFINIEEGIRNYMAQNTPEGMSYKVGGTYIRTVHSANRMAISQLFGTFIAFTVLFVVAYFAILNLKLILLAFVANLLPIFGVYGVLGILGETLNMGTTTIAAIAIGIGMDDTMHFITRYMSGLEATGDPVKSAKHVIHSSGVSMTLTSGMIALAFLTLSLSIIKPIYQLGVFTSVTMALCLLADLFLMPVLVTRKEDVKKALQK